jgi:hypothetical protein
MKKMTELESLFHPIQESLINKQVKNNIPKIS